MSTQHSHMHGWPRGPIGPPEEPTIEEIVAMAKEKLPLPPQKSETEWLMNERAATSPVARMDDETITKSLQELANNVCGKLPDGWRIDISLERGSGWADLFNPDGDLRDTGPADCDESIAECVRRMVQMAIDIANPK